MKVLHILKTAPDDEERKLIDLVSDGDESSEVRLYEGPVDYDDLVRTVFANDKVLSWW